MCSLDFSSMTASLPERATVRRSRMPCSPRHWQKLAYTKQIEHGIDGRDVLAKDGFQPALGLNAVERMARIAGKRVCLIKGQESLRLQRPTMSRWTRAS